MSSSFLKFPVHVEAQIRDGCMTPQADIVDLLTEILQSSCPVFQNGQLDLGRAENIDELCDNVAVGDMEEGKVISFWQADLCVHAFRLTDQEPAVMSLITLWVPVAFLLPLTSKQSFLCFLDSSMVFKNSKTTLRFSFLILYMRSLQTLILYCISALN